MTLPDDRRFVATLVGDGRSLLVVAALGLLACGAFGIFQASTGRLLPHDSAFLGMSGEDLCAIDGCRILHFMIHDRVAFGGVLVAIGILYLWLAEFPLRDGEAWAWWALAVSTSIGFLSFLSCLGYGYVDAWHEAATIALVPFVVGGLLRTRHFATAVVPPEPLDFSTRVGRGRTLLLLASTGIAMAGLVITVVGMTTVFVPQDLEFIGRTPGDIAAIQPHLVPLIAHDRAGFGGALASFGVVMFAMLRYGRSAPALWEALTLAGLAGFGSAVGIHPMIGYFSVVHLGPALVGLAVFGCGLVLVNGGTVFARP
jgi:hypothetical protein